MNKVPNSSLIDAGIETMRRNNRPLTRLPSRGRSLIFQSNDNQTVRIRTCNDHVLIAMAETAEITAPLNIEGTDLLLIVMPEVERTLGPVMAFLVPAEVAAKAARDGYQGWLSQNPHTKGNNRTRNIWFDTDLTQPGHGYIERWKQYQIASDVIAYDAAHFVIEDPAAASTDAEAKSMHTDSGRRGGRPTAEKLGDVIARARREIAEAAGINLENVHIKVVLT